MDQCLKYEEPEPPEPHILPGAGALRTFYLEPELEPKYFPGGGAVKNFHGSASLATASHFQENITFCCFMKSTLEGFDQF